MRGPRLFADGIGNVFRSMWKYIKSVAGFIVYRSYSDGDDGRLGPSIKGLASKLETEKSDYNL